MLYKCDLHIHSRFSFHCSKYINLQSLVEQAKLQGINCLGTGDILHPEWYNQVKSKYKKFPEIKFIPSVELADKFNAHHLVILRNFQERDKLYNLLEPYSINLDSNGRPRIRLNGKELGKILYLNKFYFGPAHVFSPYTGGLAIYKSLQGIYGEFSKHISFFQLGLDACPNKVGYIPELKNHTGIKNSDCHSVKKLGREYFCIDLQEFSVENLIKGIKNRKIYYVSSIPSLARWYRTHIRNGKEIPRCKQLN
jgi:PHP family Zn ribbon phosphoesterase